PYQPLWHWQQQLVQQRHRDPSLADLLILTEHLPVYTFGRGADLAFAKFDLGDPKIEWHRVERGGEVTFHAPGQIVGYPILNLSFYQQDLHWYLRQLEQVLILTLAGFDIPGQRIDRLTGVWVKEQKIAQIGIKCSKWITMHGFALNVNLDLAGFEQIVPCGISDRACCSMEEFVPGIEVTAVMAVVAAKFTQVFNLELVPCQPLF
ncbi:MAG: lipoyl(octanoyl) transferase LipB, partial [Pseudanabaenaceae cyanobacterium bins.68]|nr:lipoyl(octanoyl) transferase LipB [Pseudanabaenaceae cyanobacterium bins.68]